MKKIIVGLLGIICMDNAMAVCTNIPLTKFEQKRGWVHRICGEVTPIQGEENLYQITNIMEVLGDAIGSQMYFFQSKNKICSALLPEGLVGGEARYVRGSMKKWGRALRDTSIPTIASIHCEIK